MKQFSRLVSPTKPYCHVWSGHYFAPIQTTSSRGFSNHDYRQNLSKQVKFVQLASTFRQIEQTAPRNEKIRIFKDLLETIGKQSQSMAMTERRKQMRRDKRQTFGEVNRLAQILQPIVVDKDQAIKDFVRVAINLFAPRLQEDFDLQIAENLTVQSLAQCFSCETAKVKELVRKVGDYGDVAVQLRSE